MKPLEAAQKQYNQAHFLLTCPYCGTKLVVNYDDLHKQLYDPKEVEEESDLVTYETDENGRLGKILGTQKVKQKVLRSSDPDKDVYKNIKCCCCGHVWDEPVKDMYKKRCNPDGRVTEIFELTEEETKRAAEFRNKHSHEEEFRAQGKITFTALGQQFTYTITPGGLGSDVTIKCNHCGETKNITNVDNW